MTYQVSDDLGEAWAASPMNGVDLNASAGVGYGDNTFSSKLTVDGWTVAIILTALGLLWLFGGVIFRRINIF
jgi:hypothetical protein